MVTELVTNKHVITALIVAPLLALLAWMAATALTVEQPRVALAGQSYPLVEQSNCRYQSGSCDLENEQFKLRLTYHQGPGHPQLLLQSSHRLEGVLLALVEPNREALPGAMLAADDQGREWRLEIEMPIGTDTRIRLVASARGSSWFADAATRFLQPSGQ